MENKTVITQEDEAYINAGIDDPDRIFRRSIIQAAIDLNGASDAAQPGVAVSYIPEDQYYHRVTAENLNPKQYEIYEQAINWNALGRGKGALAGAAVRWGLRAYFRPERESKLVKVITDAHLAIVKEYIAYLAVHKQTFAVWYSNKWNVLGLATSCFIRESHHWDANNTRPIKALLGSLSQDNEIPESEYRKLFYLSIHPIPLDVMTYTFFKSLDPKDIDVSATVKTRLNVAPAGYADVCACAIAAESFVHEDFADRCLLIKDIQKVLAVSRLLKTDPISFHPYASSLGVSKKEVHKAPLIEAMIVLGAYAKTCIGGTLANSPALNKFLEQHARKVTKLSRGFADYNDRKSDDLIRVLTGADSTDIEVLSDKIRPLAKLADKLKNMSSADDSPVFRAALAVEEKIGDLVSKIEKDLPQAPVTLTEEELRRGIAPFVLPAELVKTFAVDQATLERVAGKVKPNE